MVITIGGLKLRPKIGHKYRPTTMSLRYKALYRFALEVIGPSRGMTHDTPRLQNGLKSFRCNNLGGRIGVHCIKIRLHAKSLNVDCHVVDLKACFEFEI